MPLKSKLNTSELSDKMLEHIPDSIFESNNTTFFDPWINGGFLARSIECKLRRFGHSDDNISSRVFGMHNRQLLLNAAVNRCDLVGNYYVGDLNTQVSNLYDVVVTMPPFNDVSSLAKRMKSNPNVTTSTDGGNAYYLKYVSTFYRNCKSYFAAVMQLNRWFDGKHMNFRKKSFDNMGLYRAELLSKTYYRDTNAKNLSMFHFMPNRNGTAEVYIKGEKVSTSLPKDLTFDSSEKIKMKRLLSSVPNIITNRIMVLSASRKNRSDIAPHLSKNRTSTHNVMFYETATNVSYIDDLSSANDDYCQQWRVGFSEITHPNTIGKLVILKPGETCSARLYFIVCADEIDADNVRKQLSCMEKYWEFVKNSNTNSRQYIQFVPDVGINIDSLIKDGWNLTNVVQKSDYSEEQMSFDF